MLISKWTPCAAFLVGILDLDELNMLNTCHLNGLTCCRFGYRLGCHLARGFGTRLGSTFGRGLDTIFGRGAEPLWLTLCLRNIPHKHNMSSKASTVFHSYSTRTVHPHHLGVPSNYHRLLPHYLEGRDHLI